jgi:gas vesicle protein
MGQDPSEIRQDIEQTRAEMGDTIEALAYKTDVKTRAKESVSNKVQSAKDSVSSKVESVKSKAGLASSKVGDAAPSGQDVKQGARKAAGIAQENPLGLALGAVAVGFVAGLAAPSTRVEDERIGQVADQVKEKARETGEEALQRGKQVAQEAAQSAKDTAQQSGQEHAQQLKESARESAQEVSPGS